MSLVSFNIKFTWELLFLIIPMICLVIIAFIIYFLYNVGKFVYNDSYLNFFNKNDFCLAEKKIINDFGNKKLKNVYLVKHKPYYYSILCEFHSVNNLKKFLLIEKINTLALKTSFKISHNDEIKKIKFTKKLTLKSFIEKIKKKANTKELFSWKIYNNNNNLFISNCLDVLYTNKKKYKIISPPTTSSWLYNYYLNVFNNLSFPIRNIIN